MIEPAQSYVKGGPIYRDSNKKVNNLRDKEELRVYTRFTFWEASNEAEQDRPGSAAKVG